MSCCVSSIFIHVQTSRHDVPFLISVSQSVMSVSRSCSCHMPLGNINFSVGVSSAGRISDSTSGSHIDVISYGTSRPDANGDLSWQDHGDLPSKNVSRTTSIGEDGTFLQDKCS